MEATGVLNRVGERGARNRGVAGGALRDELFHEGLK
jgi:hypothetical protein